MARLPLIITLLAVAASAAHAEDLLLPPVVRAHAVRRTSGVTIDGRLDEGAWSGAPKQSGFTQRFPKDGAKASLETRFAVLYDNDALFVGVWADDPEPQKIRRLLTRRDVDAPADSIAIGIDSYRDKRTAYMFQLNAAGVQRDMLMFDDSQSDDKWDAVWTGNVAVSATGWTAEFRIPLNQLRFAGGADNEWGLQVVRMIGRSAEQAAWSPWPRTGSETVSKFGVVDGIDQLRQTRRLELLPYATAGFEKMPVESGDPLNDSLSGRGNLGLDLKYGLGPAFTLSATINPDFGQVEADPSQVNLSANELFFAEKRPFFLEGVDLFKLPIGHSENPIETAFYSRRIGAAPPVEPDNYDFIDMPQETTIYGAAKLTGKTPGGWSIGTFDAVTGEETATIVDGEGMRSEPVVAPLTNYLIARVKRDLREGKTSIGASTTAVNRALSGTGLESILHDQAYTAGAQLSHRWDHNAWGAIINATGSYVHGSEDAIARTQQLQRHLFQRPDARSYHFDPTRTSLAGGDLSWRVGRNGDTKHWRYMWGGDVRTAGLELNDAGFQQQSDRTVQFWWAQYHDEDPGEKVLNWQVNADVFIVADEISRDPRLGTLGYELNANVQLANYWQLGSYANLARDWWSAGALRGGPSLRLDPSINLNAWVTSDTRKPVWLNFSTWGWQAPDNDSISGGVDVGVTVQARSNIDLFVGPSWSANSNSLQYVDQVPDENDQLHFVFGRLRQTTAGLTFRMNWTFSPSLSMQAYAQPFVSAGRYTNFKDVSRPGARNYLDRFDPLEGNQLMLSDSTYTAINNGAFSFDKPDFNFRQVRSTVVLRWEYRPGSSVFAIWSHGRTSTGEDGRYRLGSDLSALGDADSENVVMVKANYWVGF